MTTLGRFPFLSNAAFTGDPTGLKAQCVVCGKQGRMIGRYALYRIGDVLCANHGIERQNYLKARFQLAKLPNTLDLEGLPDFGKKIQSVTGANLA